MRGRVEQVLTDWELGLDADALTNTEREPFDRLIGHVRAALEPQPMDRVTVDEALRAWEALGPTSLTVALMADALYGLTDA